TSAPPRCVAGGSQSNAWYCSTAATSAPKPIRVTASCATTARFVFLTDETSVSSSRGCSGRGATTSSGSPWPSAPPRRPPPPPAPPPPLRPVGAGPPARDRVPPLPCARDGSAPDRDRLDL